MSGVTLHFSQRRAADWEISMFEGAMKYSKALYASGKSVIDNLLGAIVLSPLFIVFFFILRVLLYRVRKRERSIDKLSYFDLKQLSYSLAKVNGSISQISSDLNLTDVSFFVSLIVDQLYLINDSLRRQSFLVDDLLTKYRTPTFTSEIFTLVSDEEIWSHRPKSKNFAVS